MWRQLATHLGKEDHHLVPSPVSFVCCRAGLGRDFAVIKLRNNNYGMISWDAVGTDIVARPLNDLALLFVSVASTEVEFSFI